MDTTNDKTKYLKIFNLFFNKYSVNEDVVSILIRCTLYYSN